LFSARGAYRHSRILLAFHSVCLLLGLVVLATDVVAWSQMGIPGDWDSFADTTPPWQMNKVSPPGTPGGADWFTNVVKVASSGGDTTGGTKAFKLRGDQNWTYNWGNGATVSIDATTSLGSGGANAQITVDNGYYYAFRTINPPHPSAATIGVMKLSAPPVTVARASQSPTAPRTNDTVTVNITLGASKSSEERVFVRWTTNNFTTSYYVEASGSGTAYASIIPALPSGVTNKYYVFSTTVASPSDSTIDYLTLNLDSNAGNNYTYTASAMPWPGGATGGYPSDPAANIHHFKEQAVIGNGYILCMLDLNGSLYDIYFPSVGARYGSGTANEGYRGPQEFPYCGSLDAQANGQMNVINGMGGIGLSRGGTNSIHWLKNQVGTDYTNIGQKWQSDDVNVVYTTNKLNITSHNILVQQYDFVPSTNALPVISDGTRTNYGVYVKRFLLTNLESTTNTVDFYYDVNFNVKGANMDDAMYWETTVGGTNYNAMIVYDNTARTVTGTGCNPNGYGDNGFGAFDAAKNYNPTSFGTYDRNASVYFATVMKLVTNTVSGLGLPADGSWRDHTGSDNQEGWIGKRITIPPGETNEVDVMIVGSWDDSAGQTGTHNFWGRRMISWFYTNNIAGVQSTTEGYWSNWVNSGVTVDFPGTYYDRLWKRQLLVAATHQDAVNGSIIAGSHNGAYPYCWPRDGAYAAITFARTGHTNEALNFIHFLRDVAYRDTDTGIGDKGFFYQKYTTDGYQVWTAAQVDETASVPWALFYIYSITGDSNFLTNNWNLAYTSGRASSEDSTISPSGLYFDDTYNLMYANNVWEDQNMLTLYGNSAVVRGLYDAANIAGITGNSSWSTTFSNRAANIRDNGMVPRINVNVEAADISLLGLTIPYEVFAPTNSVMTNIVEKIHGRQGSAGGSYFDNLVETSAGIAGLLRRYNRKTTSPSSLDDYWNGEAWFLASSWYAEYFSRWQDYVPGKQMITTNLYILNLLTNMMDNIMIGAEQVAPDGSQKYTGFRLQTSWPNLWEADTTMVDQMSMFLDYKPHATNNTCYFAPKLPVGWDRIAYNNMMFRNQRFDIAIAETNVSPQTTTNVITTVNKKNTGDFNCDIYLRVPVDQISNANHIVIALTNEFLAGASTNGFVSSVNSNTGAIRVNGPFTTAAQTNSIGVYPDTEKQGVTDFWKAQHGMAASSNSAAVLANGLTIKQSYLAGLNPNSATSKLAISNISVSAAGTVTVNWLSQQDGTTLARLYDVYRMQGPFTNGASWSRISANVSSAGATTAINEDVSASTITQRFYRVTIAGHTNDLATAEIVGVHKLTLREGRNYISMSMLPGTNTLLSVLGTNQLPQGATESAATTVDIWDQTNQTFSNSNRYWLDTGTSGWRQSNTAVPSNGVLLDANKGMIVTIRTGQGNQTLRTVGFVPTSNQVQTVKNNGYTVASSTFPRPVALADAGLVTSGFTGGSNKIFSDVLYFYDPVTQGWTTEIWYSTVTSGWVDETGQAATKQLQPGESFLIRRRNRASDMTWTNTVPYTTPLQGP
jgi:GH15 family glucan-1,4-alpha-glucosidase